MAAVRTRRRREYLILLDKAKEAADCAIDNYNNTKSHFRTEVTFLLLSAAWELLSKSILVQSKEKIKTGNRGETISAEKAISKLLHKKLIEQHESDIIQQIISLRNAAAHDVLPDIPIEVQHHLMYYACKFFREVVTRQYPNHARDMQQNYLCLSFSELTTYADKVQKTISKISKKDESKKLVWLLERGLDFDGEQYLTEKQFDAKIRGKKRKLPYLKIGKYLNETDMVRIVPVEAPKNYSADVSLRKGDKRDSSLPVVVTRYDSLKDYPYFTSDIATKISKSTSYTAKLSAYLSLKGDDRYHQELPTSKKSTVQKYNETAVNKIVGFLAKNPDFNPYKLQK